MPCSDALRFLLHRLDWQLLCDQVLDDVGPARRITEREDGHHANGAAGVDASGDLAGDPPTIGPEQQQHQQQQPDLRHRPADIACALNFGLCLLHTPQAALAYLRCVQYNLTAAGN